ncbi:MAG: mannose-6-phosphate isomerase, class I [Treponema sp.]|jgi:mannose-6-phosphate isomerase|nr:mannose-6-phosphate isomerase, class I [Treponema sp.]
MAANDLHLEILGTSFSITTDEDPAYLEEILNQYRTAVENTQNIFGMKDPLKIAVLAGFLLCDEINKIRTQAGKDREKAEARRESEDRELEQRTLNLIARLDRVLEDKVSPLSKLFKLRNQVKHYEWGSPEWIPRLLGVSNKGGRPWAELWMGSHPAAPSRLVFGESETGLGELIAGNPAYYLGKRGAEQYGSLPFLFKLLAADRPLSIQAHPNKAQAREGFEREGRAGLALDAPDRNYKDPNHKPEIICALTPFTGMCGFRPPAEIRRLLGAFLSPAPASLREGFSPLLAAVNNDEAPSALRNFTGALFGLSAAVREELTRFILRQQASGGAEETDAGAAAACGVSAAQRELMYRFAELYPGDPALISPLYLNLFSLEPGEAVFLPAGILHAYIYGFGIELMASSDNVLRGGLTPKHVDLPELLKILDFSPFKPEILKPPPENSGGAQNAPAVCFRYPAPCKEFSLSVMRSTGGKTPFCGTGPAICIVTEGELAVGEKGEIRLKRGESFFIPAGDGDSKPPEFQGNFTLYAASLPAP